MKMLTALLAIYFLFRELESELDAENRRFGDAQKVSRQKPFHDFP
jgi:hypothetical protein